MRELISQMLKERGILLCAPLSLSDCSIQKPYLLQREGIPADGTAFLFAVPYYTAFCDDPARNISAYAVSADYHLFFRQLFDEILPILRARFPQHRFAGFTDHSPIAEVEAAVRAGLGVLGCNRLLLTKAYSSYVFIGEILTDAQTDAPAGPLRRCTACGACHSACPVSLGEGCLSALTQKKGELDESMQGVEFELRNAKGELIKLTLDEKGYYVDKEKDGDTDVIVIDSNNRTSIRGLDDGTYQLVETKTLDGYNLLKAPVIFTVSSETAVAGEEFTYAQAATPEEGEYFKIEEGKGYYIEQAINDTDTMKVRIDITGHSVGDYISVAEGKDVYSYVLTGDALIDEKMSNQNKLVTTRYEYRWSDAETMNWNSNYGQAGQDGLDDGTFTFTVVNRKGFEIPSTGGMGVMPYILGGGMIVLVGGVGMMKLKKKED